MEIVLGVLLIIALVVIAWLVLRQQQRTDKADTQAIMMLQQALEALRSEVTHNLRSTVEGVSNELRDVRDLVFNELAKTTSSVNEQTKLLLEQMGGLDQRMGNRLDTASAVIGNVQRGLGELSKATEQLKELSGSVVELQQLLRAPKSRGGFGELLLEDLLKQVIPAGHFEMQHRFRNGQAVDAIIRTANGIVPIDSKFPLENFQKMIAAQNDEEERGYRKQFISDIKKHIDSIASKYINTDEGTFDFALMYIPAENIYYETVIRDDNSELYEYGISKRVVPVSPNTFYAHLRVIALGLKGLQIEKSAREILSSLKQLQIELRKFQEAFNIVGNHLENAMKKYGEADKRLSRFADSLEHVGSPSLPDEQLKLPE